jgi:hypothetical protein
MGNANGYQLLAYTEKRLQEHTAKADVLFDSNASQRKSNKSFHTAYSDSTYIYRNDITIFFLSFPQCDQKRQ